MTIYTHNQRLWVEGQQKNIPGFGKTDNQCCFTCKYMDLERSLCTKFNLDFTSEDDAITVENQYEYVCGQWRSVFIASVTLDDPDRMN